MSVHRTLSCLVAAISLAACTTASAPQTTGMSGKSVIVPDDLRETYETLQFAPATRAGNFLFLSGVVARVEPGEASIDPAVDRMFDEIEMILTEAGADWSDVVDVTSYLTDLDAQLGPMWAVKANRVPEPYPSWTAIGIDRLYGGDNAIIEIKVTAYLPNKKTKN